MKKTPRDKNCLSGVPQGSDSGRLNVRCRRAAALIVPEHNTCTVDCGTRGLLTGDLGCGRVLVAASAPSVLAVSSAGSRPSFCVAREVTSARPAGSGLLPGAAAVAKESPWAAAVVWSSPSCFIASSDRFSPPTPSCGVTAGAEMLRMAENREGGRGDGSGRAGQSTRRPPPVAPPTPGPGEKTGLPAGRTRGRGGTERSRRRAPKSH